MSLPTWLCHTIVLTSKGEPAVFVLLELQYLQAMTAGCELEYLGKNKYGLRILQYYLPYRLLLKT